MADCVDWNTKLRVSSEAFAKLLAYFYDYCLAIRLKLALASTLHSLWLTLFLFLFLFCFIFWNWKVHATWGGEGGQLTIPGLNICHLFTFSDSLRQDILAIKRWQPLLYSSLAIRREEVRNSSETFSAKCISDLTEFRNL